MEQGWIGEKGYGEIEWEQGNGVKKSERDKLRGDSLWANLWVTLTVDKLDEPK
jgi:hypothetical protein